MDGGDGIEPWFLQAKEAQPSVLAEYCGRKYHNQGERVVAGQHLMQAESDIFLGWTHVPGSGPGGPRLLRPSAAGLEIVRADRAGDPLRHDRLRPPVRVDPGPRRRPLRRPHRPGRLPRQHRHPSITRSPTSPKPTPTKTNATTPPCRPPSKTARPRPWPRSKPGSMANLRGDRGALLPGSAPRAFHLLARPTGAAGNLDCTYCFSCPRRCSTRAASSRWRMTCWRPTCGS
jgi:Uncharacterized protein conserved in bacteria (DUF2252)